MPTGFQSVNDWGTVQIDENYKTINARNAPVVTFSGLYYYDCAGTNPMLFLGDTGGQLVTIRARASIGANVWRFQLFCNNTVTVRLFHFDDGPGWTGNAGMQVFNASGELVYDSSNLVLKLQGLYQIPQSTFTSIDFPQDGKTYAAALSYYGKKSSLANVHEQYWSVSQQAIAVTATQAITGFTNVGIYQGSDLGDNWGGNLVSARPHIIVVDVTGI